MGQAYFSSISLLMALWISFVGQERAFPFAAAKIASLFIRMGEKSGIVEKNIHQLVQVI